MVWIHVCRHNSVRQQIQAANAGAGAHTLHTTLAKELSSVKIDPGQLEQVQCHAGEGEPNEHSGHHLLVITTLACFSEGELVVSRIAPGLAVACTMARHSPLKAFRRFDL